MPGEQAFAYYLPFHFYKSAWGSYVRAFGVDQLARMLGALGPITESSLILSFRLLLEHERLHFLAEVAASRLEVASHLPSYRPYFADPRAATHGEAVANAQALTVGGRGASAVLTQAASTWMSQQGPGYRDFSKWMGPHLPLGKREAALFMLPSMPPGSHSRTAAFASMVTPGRPAAFASDVVGGPGPRAWSGSHRPPNWPGELLFDERRRPPTYLVVDVAVPWLRIARPFRKLHGLQVSVHTNDHKPPHIHIAVLNRRTETRYEWPALRPLRGDAPLSRADEKKLRAYVATMGSDIDSKVKSVLWS